jgi:hypothetical protein
MQLKAHQPHMQVEQHLTMRLKASCIYACVWPHV